MALVWSDIVAVAPELASLDATMGAIILSSIQAELGPDNLGADRYERAVKYLTAHVACCLKSGAFGVQGAVTSESVGGISRAYAANSPMGTHPWYDKTPYGKLYQFIIHNNPARVGLVV